MKLVAQLVAYGLFLFSGATALVYQVTWLRELSLIFGASFYATSIVLASFMGGLALGGFSAGRLSGRLSRPLATYGALEIAIAVFAMLLPPLLGAVDEFYLGTAQSQGAVTPALNSMRFALSFGVLLLPTFFMGATLPVLIRFMVHAHGELGTRLSLLYGINTCGAAGGAILAGFVLLPNLGNSATQQVAVISNLAIGILAIGADFWVGRPATEASETAANERAASESPDLGPLPLQLAFFGTAITGMSALALEVLWTRAISVIIGSTTYSFTIMLAAFLTGIWIGSWLHASFPFRRINESVQFGVIMVAIGISSFVTSQLIPRVPLLVLWLNQFLYQDRSQIQTGTSLLGAFAVMLIPCIFMGIAFPIASQARARLKLKFGESVGDTLALNTCGSIVGSLAAGFVLIPMLGIQGGMVLASALAAGFGGIVLTAAATAGSSRRSVALSAAVALALLLVAVGPLIAPRWDLDRLATFRHDRIRSYFPGPQGQRLLPELKLINYAEGRSSTVAVMDSRWSREAGKKTDLRRVITVNGKVVASDGSGDMDTQLLLGHVPVLLHPNPKSALVIGFGAGVTLGAVAAHKDIEEITLIEIEPAVLDSGSLFAHVNDDVLQSDPRLEVIIQDGRNFLKTTNRKFDVITADPVHPWAAGSAYLYTTEYYAEATRHLNEGGVMCQWVPLSALSIENFKSIIGTFAQNFKYVSVWTTATDFALVGSNSPFQLSVDELSERLAEPDVHRQLNWIGLADSKAFLARLAVETTGVRIYSEGAFINTDDNLYLEFSSPLAIGDRCEAGNLCGMSAWYPSRIQMVENWQPLFDTAREATASLREYREKNPEKLIKDLPDLPRAVAE
ncbi:MAG: fused MFS/spermidine synthase [Myxococcota bacterium]